MSKSIEFGQKTQGTLGVKFIDLIMCIVECFYLGAIYMAACRSSLENIEKMNLISI